MRDFNESEKHKNLNYVELNYGPKFEYHALDNGYNSLYMYWATDLLPEEIDRNMSTIKDMKIKNEINFVGSLTRKWYEFYNLCCQNGIKFNNYGASFDVHSKKNVSVTDNMELTKQSIIAPALQDDMQIKNQYIPCRIFKNISYGKMGITNNKIVDDLFDNKLIYDTNLSQLLHKGLLFEKDSLNKNETILDLMKIVRDNHTYINRANTIMKYINNYTNFTISM